MVVSEKIIGVGIRGGRETSLHILAYMETFLPCASFQFSKKLKLKYMCFKHTMLGSHLTDSEYDLGTGVFKGSPGN